MLEFFRKYSKWVIIFIVGSALIAVYKTFDSLSSIFGVVRVVFGAIKPFIIAFVIAYILNIPVKQFDRLIKQRVKYEQIKNHSYGISIAVVYELFLILLVLVLCVLMPALLNNMIDMAQHLPEYLDELINAINNLDIMQKLGIHINVLQINDVFNGWVRTLDASAMGRYAQGFLSVTSGIVTAASAVMNVFISFIASVYMLLDKERLINGIKHIVGRMSGNGRTAEILYHCRSVNEIFTQYIYSRVMCCAIMAAVCSFFLTIMGERYGLLLGMFIGVMDIIPYFGSIIAWVLSAIIMAISGGVGHSVWCSAVMLVMQQIDGNIIAPKIMGSRLEIRPLAVIAAVSIGGTLFGFVGLLLSVPVVAIIRAVIADIMQSHDRTHNAEMMSDAEGTE